MYQMPRTPFDKLPANGGERGICISRFKGNITITNDAAQQQLTGQTAEQTLASINHDTANNATLANLYEQDKDKIQTGFAIGKGLSQNFASFMNYMAQDMDSVANAPAVGKDGKPIIGADGKPMTNQEAYQAGLELGDTVNKAGDTINYGTRQDLWGSGGTGNRIATALIGAYSGNVSNGASTLLQNTALNVVRTYGATEIKHLADGFSTETDDKGNPIPNATSETVRGLLHAVAGCAGASATGGDCASAGLASAGTVAMNNAMTALLNLNPNDMTDTQKQAYSNLMGTLVAGVSTAVGGDAAAAQLASKVEVENNYLTRADVKRYADTMNACKLTQGKDREDCITSAFTLAQNAHLRNEAALERDCTGSSANVEKCNQHKQAAAEGSKALREASSNLMIAYSAPSALGEMKTWQLHAPQAVATLNYSEERKVKDKLVKDKINKHADNAKKINAQRSLGDNATAFATTILGNGKDIVVGAYDATADAAKGVWGVVSDYDAHDANQRTQERITSLANSAAYVASGEVVIDGVTYGKYLLDNPNLIVMTAEDTADATTVVASVILVPKILQGGTKAASASTKIVTENIGDWKAGQAVKAAEKATVDATRVEAGANADNFGLGNSATRDFQAGATHRAENINAGQVTDRDGLQRVDDAKTANDQQVKEVSKPPTNYWATGRPAWKEGTTVTDRVTTKTETVNMVVNKDAYDKIVEALRNRDTDTAVNNLGGWATPDPIKTVGDVRNNLAISSEWKGQGGQQMYSIQIEVQPGAKIRQGTVGDMWDKETGTRLPGGGQQIQFMDNLRTNPNLIKIDLSKSVEIKP